MPSGAPPSVDPRPRDRAFVGLDESVTRLGLEGSVLVERRGRHEERTPFGSILRAFVALGQRARALALLGIIEAPAEARVGARRETPSESPSESPSGAPRLASLDAIERYASALDPAVSLPQLERVIARSLTPALTAQDERAADALATLALLEWPSSLDVGALLEPRREAPSALHRVLVRELERDPACYPKELVRLALVTGSRPSASVALAALRRTRSPDAWLDVLIEGEPLFRPTDARALLALSEHAPERDIAKTARDIARDLAPRPRRARRALRR